MTTAPLSPFDFQAPTLGVAARPTWSADGLDAARFALGSQVMRSARHLTISLANRRTGVVEAVPGWLDRYVRRLNDLLELGAGWDGDRAKPITPASAARLTRVLVAVMHPDNADPQIVPLFDGGLQAEWHALDYHVEIEAGSDGEVFATAIVPGGQLVVDEAIDPTNASGTTALQKALRELSEFVEAANRDQ